MANEFGDEFGDIVPFKKKDDKIPIKDERIAKAIYKTSNRTNKQQKLSNDLIPDDLIPNDLIPNDLIPNDLVDKNNKDKCDITGEIVSYKRPVGLPSVPTEDGIPGGPPPSDMSVITKILREHHAILKQIAKIEEDLKNFLMGYSKTGTYFELRTETTVATSIQPATPDTVADANTIPPTPGYDFIDINKQKQGNNAQKLWIINDGPPAAGVGDNLYVITSSDGMSFSPEFTMIVGETRLVNNVYEVRIRSPKAGDVVRITEREAIVPYVTTVTNTLTPIGNRENFIARNVTVNMVDSILPSITIPDGFILSIRANINNTFGSHIYISRTDATVSANRNTLYAGDVMGLIISDANIIHVAGSEDGLTVDLLAEQD